ncbi:polysaccharide biosynthesis family protein [Chondrocystis sp. NIES-4102]|nr:polysaccharide biosynthesis family protein [Chondrocystis sp. NIES-4102]
MAKVVNITCQAAYFTIIVRILGKENYGSFVGIAALAGLIFPFANLGSADVLIQQVSRDKKVFYTYWGNTLIIVFVASLLLTIVAYCISLLFFPAQIDWRAILAILLADLTGLSIFVASAKAFVSYSLLKNSSLLQIISTVNKLIAAIVLAVYFNQPSLWQWAYLYLLSAVVTAIIGIIWVNKTLGKPQLDLKNISPIVAEGVYFSIGESAYNINSNIDKTMLTSMATLEATGIYGAAYRLVEVVGIPIFAILSASYPKFFELGQTGIAACLGLVKKILPFAVIYGIFALIGFITFAPRITWLLGDEYQSAIAAVRWLAPIPIIGSFQLLLADTLTGAGFQKTRSAIQVTTACTNVLLNLWLIPIYSWRGAAWATIASDSFRVLGLAIAVGWHNHQQKQHSNK